MIDTNTPILEIQNLTKIYNSDLFKKKHVAVDNLSCRFMRNKCTGLLGHNGAGKTTTIKMIFGLVFPTKGKILFNSGELETANRRNLGYMPEVSRLPRNLTGLEILNFNLRLQRPEWDRKKRSEVIESGLHKVAMWDVRNKKIKSLSKGMGRRIAWLQATIHDPDLVVLDEPFSGLDPVARMNLLEWVREFRDAGKSLILCTHELWSVRELCDEVHVFKKGKLVYSTLDEGTEQRQAGLNSAHYQVTVSGTNIAQLEAIGKGAGLRPWTYANQENFLCRMTFVDYEVAASWLGECVRNGLIVVRFADEISVEDETIRSLFSGGSLQ